MRFFLFLILFLSLMVVSLPAKDIDKDIPKSIINPATRGLRLRPEKPRLGISRQQLYPTGITGPDKSGEGLILDLGDTTLFGEIYSGVFYFEYHNSDFIYSRFRERHRLENGRGIISIREYFNPRAHTNVNGWTDQGVIAYRLNLWRKTTKGVRPLGLYDSCVRFIKKGDGFEKALTLTEGPIVNLITSDHPDWLVISLETDIPSRAEIELKGASTFTDRKEAIRHEIRLQNLLPDTEYRYRVIAWREGDTLRSPYFSFRTAPRPGSSPVVFAYTGDGRAGQGGGEREYIGVNRYILQQIAAAVYRQGARFLLFGGDMISGYTDYAEDFILQFKAFKQALFGFLLERPLYTAVGNHEALLHTFEDGSRYGLGMDKWPYRTSSVEAVFAREFVHPENGPEPYPDTPPYRETVYSFTYGNVKIIVFNNNYWWTSHRAIPHFGGNPEGYILPNQMEWIQKELQRADSDPAIRYVLLMAQEPVFPNGGHAKDAMWYFGDNRLRAYMSRDGKKLKPFDLGIIEVRNRFWEMVSASPKVVAVLCSDEHAYHRTLITRQTPVGLFPQDDLDGNGKLDDGQISPNPRFRYPVWHIVSGGAGAPYYVQEDTPWKDWVKIYTSHYNYILLKAYPDRISLQVYNLTGQLLDSVDDLTAVKKQGR